MTARESTLILQRLDDIEREVRALRADVERARGAWMLIRLLITIAGVTGIGALINWLSSQGVAK